MLITALNILTASEDEQGHSFNTYTPKHNFNLWSKYSFSEGVLQNLDLGGGLRAVSNTYDGDKEGKTQAPGYTIFSLQAGYAINDNLKLVANIENLFDKKYYEKVADWYRQNFYGSPRSLTVTLRGSF